MLVSHSQLDTYFTCPAQYYWGYVKRLQPRSKNYDLMYGAAIHKVLARYFLCRNEEIKPELSLLQAEQVWRHEFMLPDLGSFDHKTKTLEAGAKFINLVAGLRLEERGKIIKVETMTQKPMAPGIVYRGKVDLLLQKPDGTRIVIDFKTKGRLGSNYFYFSALDRQMKGYRWLEHQWNGNRTESNTIILHCVKSPQVYENTQGFEDDEIELWVEETVAYARDIQKRVKYLKPSISNILFPRAGTRCQMWGCWAFDLCVQGRFEDAVVDPGRFVEKEEQE